MIIISEKKTSRKILEAADKIIQKMALDLFRHLSVRGLPRGRSIPDFNEASRKAHAMQFQEGVEEFTSALSDYIEGYAGSMEYDERKYKADYASEIYRVLSQSLAKV